MALGQTSGDRDVSWKELVPNILEDQQQIWTYPARTLEGHNIVPTVAFSAATTATILWADPPGAHYFRNTNTFHDFNSIFASTTTSLATALAPVPFYIGGMMLKNDKAKKTALFSAQALADSEIVVTVLKAATRRTRPSSIAPDGNFGDSFWEGRHGITGGSFPSGHTIAAFSVATIVARRYRERRWVPFIAYGAAMAVGFSRMTLSAHFPSDVLVGGALGYSIARFSVLRQ